MNIEILEPLYVLNNITNFFDQVFFKYNLLKRLCLS